MSDSSTMLSGADTEESHVPPDVETRLDPSHEAVPPTTPNASRIPRALYAIGLLLLASIAAVSIVSRNREKSDDVSAANGGLGAALPVNVIRAGELPAPQLSRSYSGVLIARRESRLSFERPGRVLVLAVHEGDEVSGGDVLAELDQENLDAIEARIVSELAAADALLAELIAGPRKQTLLAAEARVAQLSAQVALAKVDAARQNQLIGSKATSMAARDAAQFGLEANEKALLAEQAALAELVEGTRAEKIAAQRANRDAIKASLREIEAQRGDSQIEAPFAGTIQSRLIDEGVVVDAGASVFHLVSREIEARFGLPPTIAARLAPGMPVKLELRGREKRGWVDRLEPTIDRQTRTRRVYVRFHNIAVEDARLLFESLSEEGWVPGEIPDLLTEEIDDSAAGNRFWLPTTALSRGTRGLWTVLVVPEGEASAICSKRSVELIKTDGEHVLVQGMLQRDELVISSGVHRVTDGMLVEPVGSKIAVSTGHVSERGTER